jgi:hypothetical protein
MKKQMTITCHIPPERQAKLLVMVARGLSQGITTEQLQALRAFERGISESAALLADFKPTETITFDSENHPAT